MKNRLLLCALSAFSILACGKAPEEIPAKIPVASVSINQPSAEMLIGETVQLRATISPSDATDKTLSWASSKQSVATVSETGLVTAIAEGASTITASAGGRTGSCTVTVSKGVIAVSSVELNKTELSLVEGDSETLFASVKPDDATDKTVTWSTSNSAIAKVESGKVTAVKEGEATITAKAGNKSATCKVVVNKRIIAVTSIELDKTDIELFMGDTETLVATVKPDSATDKSVVWNSSDETIATVQDGVVTAVSAGSAIIKAKAGEKIAECSVEVKAPVVLEAIDLGLSVKWANANLGAKYIEDAGEYYAWGETEPKQDYTRKTYKFELGWDVFSKYNTKTDYGEVDNKTVLEPEDDAAIVNLGGTWRTPTATEMTELRTKCTWEWIKQNEVYGRKITGPNGNSIFLPATGHKYFSPVYEQTIVYNKEGGYYMSSSLNESSPNNFIGLYFYNKDVQRYSFERLSGYPVRPVTE